MIIKGKSRSGPRALAAHLGNAETNERITVLETRGTVADDLRGALLEMDAYAAGTRCEKSLYHAAISPGPQYRLTPEERSEAIDALEAKLGMDGHSRVVVLHEKLGRQHLHVVWSRIDLENMRSAPDSHNYRKHEEVARDLERRFGHERVQGAHHERDGVERPDRTPSRAELRQEERTRIKGKLVKDEVSAIFRASDNAHAFANGLQDKGYVLAQGDRRDFVIVDRAGGIHSLARRIDGMKAEQLREFMAPIDREQLPNIEQAKEEAVQRRIAAEDLEREKARNRLEAGYSSGADYVAQSRAAQRDFEQRQRKLDRERDAIRLFNFEEVRAQARAKARDESELLRRQAEETTKRDEARSRSAQGKPRSEAESKNDGIEMTDAKRTKENRNDADEPEGRVIDDDPDRQREAPGGGRTRSR